MGVKSEIKEFSVKIFNPNYYNTIANFAIKPS